MKTISVRRPINLKVVRFELDFSTLAPQPRKPEKKPREIRIPKVNRKKPKLIPPPPLNNDTIQKPDPKTLIEELLGEIYGDHREWCGHSHLDYSHGSTTAASLASSQWNLEERESLERSYLEFSDVAELQQQCAEWENRLLLAGQRLVKYVKMRDRLRRRQRRLCAALTVMLQHMTGDSSVRFSLTTPGGGEGPGEGGFTEWLHAMRLVARLPAGVPQHFRKKLWLTLAERHLTSKGIDWSAAERACFRGTAQPDDTELGAQILKDLHRTGCSLFCGTEGRENQAMLRRVLLAYARWNKEVGYCQGFNMLAAIILEVMDKSESDSLKVMIYLVEAVLPKGYFADDLRGLSADMAAFRDLLRLRLPRLASHMDHLQRMSDGGGVEPPLPDVFTMQWFLTLYATWLPREPLLRIWDLILLDGNEVLLLTALAIWDILQDRILSARSADEFYSCMGGGASAIWHAGEVLVSKVVALGSAPELPRLRNLHRYRVAPPATTYQPSLHTAMQSMTRKGLRLFYSEDEGDSSDDGYKMALAPIIPRRNEATIAGDRLSLDIGALKRQYARLRERQRQAHVILAAACARHAAVGVPTSPTSLTVNNLLLGKSAIVSSRGRRLGPPPGAVPPSRQTSSSQDIKDTQPREEFEGTISWNEENNKRYLSKRDSLKWKDIKKDNTSQNSRKASIDLDETGDGVIVSEQEANEMMSSIRSRSSSETSSYSSASASSSDTSLCDEKDHGSDTETDLPLENDRKKNMLFGDTKTPSTILIKETKIRSPVLREPIVNLKDKVYPTEENSDINRDIDISTYLHSTAGKPLRSYIDRFETKLKDSHITSDDVTVTKPLTSYKSVSPCKNEESSERKEIIRRLGQPEYKTRSSESIKIKSELQKFTNFTDLSPIDLSPYNYSLECNSPYEHEFMSNIKTSSSLKLNKKPDRPPDIIDDFTMYPNFVPDIDLSEKSTSDIESPLRSPGTESIVISEDEPPIPLMIDKYFEHSPEFFGARVTDPNSSDIPCRRAARRQSRPPRKPDSLTLYLNYNEKLDKDDVERASSLPQNHNFGVKNSSLETRDKRKVNSSERRYIKNNQSESVVKTKLDIVPIESKVEIISPSKTVIESGRKNSEKALQIIQENSKILNRILTKQNTSDNNNFTPHLSEETRCTKILNTKKRLDFQSWDAKADTDKKIETPVLKESISDSIIRRRKKSNCDVKQEKNDFLKTRPISIDDPFSINTRHTLFDKDLQLLKNIKSPSSECLGNRTDIYGWENKGFLAKYDVKNIKPVSSYDIKRNLNFPSIQTQVGHGGTDFSYQDISSNSKPSNHQYPSDSYEYRLSTKYSEPVVARISESEILPKMNELMLKTDNSHTSDFSNVVTSSISFTYEPSTDDDPLRGNICNSSDTLCQIASLDQISTPMSPKTFPRDPVHIYRDSTDKISVTTKVDIDDTSSAITSLLDTENTLSSLTYPRSPSTGSYHFPTRPAMRMPKELAVKLGMYSKDVISPSPK